ncbi:MAG: hypothetical protein HKN49_06080 [Gammaproteobacteria bacterium]|nr:hypothetical protein [Gammaproteobacteria bacterium]
MIYISTAVRAIAIVLVSVHSIACQSLEPAHSDDPIVGIYYLAKVDGSAVPADVDHDGVTLHVRSGMMIISEDGTCFSRTRFVDPGGTEQVRENDARYRVEESRLIMNWEGAGVTTGVIDDTSLTMNNHGIMFEYRR